MFALLGGKGAVTIMASLLSVTGMFAYSSYSYKRQLSAKTFEAEMFKSTNKSLAKAITDLEAERIKVERLLEVERRKREEREKAKNLALKKIEQLRASDEPTKVYLASYVPDKLAVFLCSEYGSQGRSDNKSKDSGMDVGKTKRTCSRTVGGETNNRRSRALPARAESGFASVF